MTEPDLIVIGGGLAGSEAAWQAAQRGLMVHLYEMRPEVATGAHIGADLAELVCSNSLGSNLPDRASGILKRELRTLGSLLIHIAELTAIPAGGALAVDRKTFSERVTNCILSHPNIEVIRREVKEIPPGLVVIASGPLTSPALAKAIASFTGEINLFFYDAIAPIITANSIDCSIAFRASRFNHGVQAGGDYLNCPLNRPQYKAFVEELNNAERIILQGFELGLESGVKAGISSFFEGCLPIEILSKRGQQALAYGPLRPVGLRDPRTGESPHAVVQLRQDDLASCLFNLVGFQTNLKFSEQQRVFRMIPGLEKADFVRFGQMHRNTFIFSPALLNPSLQSRNRKNLFFAGQITGVEGYVGNIATGLLAGCNAARIQNGLPLLILPPTTILGALCKYITQASSRDFQPMKANFGILPELEERRRGPRNKPQRALAYADRAEADLEPFVESVKSDLIEIKINRTVRSL